MTLKDLLSSDNKKLSWLWWPVAGFVALLILLAVVLSVLAIYEKTKFSQMNALLVKIIGQVYDTPRLMTEVMALTPEQPLDLMAYLQKRGVLNPVTRAGRMGIENPWQQLITLYRVPRYGLVMQSRVPNAACVNVIDFFLDHTDLGFSEIQITSPARTEVYSLRAKASRPSRSHLFEQCSVSRLVDLTFIFPLTASAQQPIPPK